MASTTSNSSLPRTDVGSLGVSDPLIEETNADLTLHAVGIEEFSKLESIIETWKRVSQDQMRSADSSSRQRLEDNQFHLQMICFNLNPSLLKEILPNRVFSAPDYQVYLARDQRRIAQGVIQVQNKDNALEIVRIVGNPLSITDRETEFCLLSAADLLAKENNKTEIRSLPLSSSVWIHTQLGYVPDQNSYEMIKRLR
jgi:hypothetical protein